MKTMSSTLTYGVVENDADAAGYARVLAHSFGRTEPESAHWLTLLPRSAMRVMKERDRVVAGLMLIHMGQYFGGASVPMIGISAVGTAPEARGDGVALEMMKRCVAEMHAGGGVISGLYPATQRLYRLAGWEQSGHRFEVRIPPANIGVREKSLAVRALEAGDKEAVRALYSRIARHHDGNLDRAPVGWDRIERPPPSRQDPARAFVVEGSSGIEGYVYLSQQAPVPPARGKHEVRVQDMLASTERAARRLWAFLGSYATMVTEIVWNAGPCHPMLLVLSEQPYKLSLQLHWMTRVLDVPRALEARGYSPHLRARVSIEVRDELVASNNGVFTLDVEGGRGRVTRGGTPTARTSVQGLAAMYTGYMPAPMLRPMGMVEGDEGALAALGSVFAGGVPWMTDMF
jgi:predicted acetyltransferase